jgi:uncharacterized protein YjbI with pentapeptide repeats
MTNQPFKGIKYLLSIFLSLCIVFILGISSEAAAIGMITVGEPEQGSVSQDNTKKYFFLKEQGKTYEIKLISNTGNADLYGRWTSDVSTTNYQFKSETTGVDSFSFTTNSDGAYYIVVYGYSSSDYTLSVNEVITFVTLSSPNSGSFTVGDSMSIEWDSTNQHHYGLYLYQGDTEIGDINVTSESTAQSYNWTIPATINNHTIDGSDYKIKVAIWNDDPDFSGVGDYSDSNITIEPSSVTTSVTLTSPDSGSFTVGDSMSIEWNSTNQHHYGLYLYQDGNEIGDINVVTSESTAQSYNWTIPATINNHTIDGNDYKIKVAIWNDDPDFSGVGDYSDSNITIEPNPDNSTAVTLTSPNSGSFTVSDSMSIEWDSTNQHHYGLYLYQDGNEIGDINVVTSETSAQSYNWTIPETLNGHTIDGSNYKIKVAIWNDDPDFSGVGDYSDSNITIEPSSVTTSVTLTSPDSGSFTVGDSMLIEWNSTNQHHYGLYLYQGDTEIGDINVTSESTAQSYNWTIPTTLNNHTIDGNNYKIKVAIWNDDPDFSGVGDYSDSNITIEPSSVTTSVTLTSPDSGSFTVGDSMLIEWDSTNQHHYGLYLYQGDTEIGDIYFTDSDSSAQSYNWTIPETLNNHTIDGSNYKIKVAIWNDDPDFSGVGDYSDSNITIEPSSDNSATVYLNVDPWAQEAAAYMVQQGIVNDPSDHNLKGTNPANRAELATMIYRALGGGKDNADDKFKTWAGDLLRSPFVDIQDGSTWYYNSVVYLSNLDFDDGITVFNRGNGEDMNPRFNPANEITRAWTLKALLEAWNLKPITDFNGVTLFSDVPTSHPAAGYIYKAREEGIVTGNKDSNGNPLNTYTPDASVRRQDIFVMLYRILNNVEPVTINADSFSYNRVCSGIGSRYEQPILYGVNPPSVSIEMGSVQSSKRQEVDVYTVELKAIINGGDQGTFTDYRGETHKLNLFAAWKTNGGCFVDMTDSGDTPYSKVKWIAPDGYSPNSGDIAKYKVTVFVGDNLGSEVSATKTIQLSDDSRTNESIKPSVNLSLPTTLTANSYVKLTGTATDRAAQDSVNYGIREVRLEYSLNNSGNWYEIATNLGVDKDNQWSANWWVPDTTGSIQVRASSKNLLGNEEKTTSTVNINPQYLIEGYVTNSLGYPLTNAKIQLIGSDTAISDNQGWFMFKYNIKAGSYNVQASFDGGQSETKAVTLSSNSSKALVKLVIYNDTDKPTITGNPPTIAKLGYNYTFTPTASDENGDNLTFSITNKPDWATFDTNTGRLSGTPNAVGNYTGIEISVSDGQLSAQLAAFDIQVKTANGSPTISGIPRTQIDVGQNYEFIPTAYDPDGDSLTFSIRNKPDWAIFDTATGKLSGQPSDSQTGTSSDIQISVTDGNTTQSLQPFSITVNSATALFKPSSLVVTAAVGGVNPTSQKLRVNYPDGYDRNKLSSYININASFAKITSTLTSSKWIEWNISFKTKKLAIGQHNGTITIKTDDGDKTVPIIINILDTAELQLSRSQLNFGAVQGGKTPKKQKIKVSSSGSKILNWSTATNANWLTIEPSQGTTTSKVKVGINASQLANVGQHSATISFIESESGATIDVPVKLDVVAANSETVKLTALEVVQVIQDLNNSIPLIAEKPTFVRAHVSSTTGKRVKNVNAKLTGKNGDTVVFEISPLNAGGSINVSDNPNRSKINDSFLFELPKEYSTANLTLEFAGVDKPFACADTGNDCTETVSFETLPAIDMKLVDIIWLRKFIAPTQKMRQAIPENIYNIYPISTLNVTQSNVPLILYSKTSLKLLRTTIRSLFLMKYFDGPAAEKQYYYGVGGKFYGTVGISLIPGTLAAGAYIKGIDLRNFANNLSCVQKVNSISSVAIGPKAIYGFNAKTKRIYPATTSDFMTKRSGSWISDYNYKCAIETLKARTRSTRSSLRSSIINTSDNTVTINGRITGTNSGVIDNLVNAVATTTADAPTAGDYKMSLQTSDGTELAAYSFGPININVGGDDDASSASSESAYSLILPRPDNMKRIVLLDKNLTKLDERIASANAPTVNLTTPNGGETIKNDAEKLTITWNANDVDGDTLTYAIDYSLDAGNNWQTLVSGYDQKSIEIDVALLAGTSQAKFRVTADDSFNSGSDESDAVFTVEGKDPEVSITNPNNGDLFISGQTINFVGQAYDKEDGKLTETSLTWSSDRDGDLITTSKLAEDLAEGTHIITLTATDSQNQTSTSTISINVYRERPTSLPATFSISEDNFTIGGYANGGTATADLTISNGGDGSLTWSAASDANWLTLSETSGTAPSDIKLIANPAKLDIGVYSGNVILTSDIPGVIAKTIEVTFRVQEAPPIVSVPVQQEDDNDDNTIDGGTIEKDQTITGATLRGNIINEGTLKDINFEGEELKGGTLAGKIANKGIIIDVKLSENTDIQGGSLRGNIVGAANASLDNLKILDNSQVNNVTLGKNVTFGTNVTLKDVKLMGASISNSKLEGTIRTASSATTIKDVVLGAKAKVIGGKLAGTIKGDSSDRALLQHLIIEATSQLTEVIIGDSVDIEAGVNLGSGVQFSKADNIPFNIDLTQTLAKINSVVDLSADLVQDGKGLLVAMNKLAAFADKGWKMEQNDKTGNLTLKVEDLSFAVTPVKVKRVESKTRAAYQNVRLGFGNTVYFTNENGIEVEAYPAVQDLATLKILLAAIELPKLTISKEGNIQVAVTDKLWLSGRAELASKLAEEAEIIGFKFKEDLVVLVFENKDGQKREQVLYPAPASALNEKASLTEEGILSFRTYKGKLDYSVENGEVIESLTVSEIADSNGDGLKDFLITYPQGYTQKLFALPAAE